MSNESRNSEADVFGDYELVFYNTLTGATGWLTASLARTPQEVIECYGGMLDSDEIVIGVESGSRSWRLVDNGHRLIEVDR